MQEPTRTWMIAAENAINNLQHLYHENRGLLLTEGDLECHLFNILMNDNEFRGFHYSKNDSQFEDPSSSNLKTSFIHSQVTWFLPEKKSGFEVDLTIADPGKLEVINIELFEKYTGKGFAYDGPCVAIELKFIRDIDDVSNYAHADYIKFRDKLIPAKMENIDNGIYKECNKENVAFITLVGCKNKEIFNKAQDYLGRHIAQTAKEIDNQIHICLFYQDEIIWNKDMLLKQYYKSNLFKEDKTRPLFPNSFPT